MKYSPVRERNWIIALISVTMAITLGSFAVLKNVQDRAYEQMEISASSSMQGGFGNGGAGGFWGISFDSEEESVAENEAADEAPAEDPLAVETVAEEVPEADEGSVADAAAVSVPLWSDAGVVTAAIGAPAASGGEAPATADETMAPPAPPVTVDPAATEDPEKTGPVADPEEPAGPTDDPDKETDPVGPIVTPDPEEPVGPIVTPDPGEEPEPIPSVRFFTVLYQNMVRVGSVNFLVRNFDYANWEYGEEFPSGEQIEEGKYLCVSVNNSGASDLRFTTYATEDDSVVRERTISAGQRYSLYTPIRQDTLFVVEDAPAAPEEPVKEQPAEEPPADNTPADEQPSGEQPSDEQPGKEQPAKAEEPVVIPTGEEQKKELPASVPEQPVTQPDEGETTDDQPPAEV